MPRRLPRFMREDTSEPDRVPATPSGIMRKAFRDTWKINLVYTAMVCIASVCTALIPWALGKVLDSGLENGLTPEILPGVGLFVGLVLLNSVTSVSEVMQIVIAMRAAWNPARRLMRVVFGRRTDVGRDMVSGDIVTAMTVDAERVGWFTAYLPSVIGSFLGFVAVVALMIGISVPLGLFVAVGMPILMAVTSWMVKPFEARVAEQREESGILTSIASDGIAGLRVMRGVGGADLYNETYAAQSARVRDAGIRASKYRARLRVVFEAGPAFFTAVVIGQGLWMTYDGAISPGALVAFYGFTAYLSIPIEALIDTTYVATRAWTGAKKMSRILAAKRLVSDAQADPGLAAPDWTRAALTDAASGVRIGPGKTVALVSGSPEESAALAARLARTDDADEVYADGVDLRRLRLAEVRKNIAYSGPIAELYMGTLRSNLLGPDAEPIEPRAVAAQVADALKPGGEIRPVLSEEPGERPADARLLRAVHAADGADVLSSTEGGLDGQVAERGRSMSGGQRQRAALARTLALDAPVTILVEPTSAVDSHTESRIAERLADCRAGKTTIVATVSPLVLGRCDEVVFLVDGKEALRGTHHELSSHPEYRAVVHRGESDEGGKAPAAPEARGEGARDVGGEKVGVDGKGGVDEKGGVGLGKADVDRENGGAK